MSGRSVTRLQVRALRSGLLDYDAQVDEIRSRLLRTLEELHEAHEGRTSLARQLASVMAQHYQAEQPGSPEAVAAAALSAACEATL